MAGKKNSLLGLVIMAVIFTGLGGGLFGWLALPMYHRGTASQKWPTTDGKIVLSRVDTSRDTKNNNKTKYTAVVQYSYAVKGQNYDFNYIWISGSHASSSRAEAQKVVDRYPVSKQVKVYYDPANPAFALLEPGVNATVYFILGVTLLFFVIGVIMSLWALFKIFIFFMVITR